MKKWYLITHYDKSPTEMVYVDRKELLTINEGGTLDRISAAYITKEEVIKDRLIPDYPCSKCGGVIDAGYRNADDFLKVKMCFSCYFYLEIYKGLKNKNRVIIEGESYTIHPNDPTENLGFSGHGGRLFKIKRFDSTEIVVTRNLWPQGAIPKEWLELIPNNAEFIDRTDSRYEST